jgi:hypothetical protein
MAAMVELFYTDGDAASQEALRFVEENGLSSQVRLRNEKDKSTQADFESNGGERWPALFDGEHLVDGRAAVMAILEGLAADQPAA